MLRTIVLLIAAVVILLSCGKNDVVFPKVTAPPDTTDTQDTADYYVIPLDAGNYWHYAVSRSYSFRNDTSQNSTSHDTFEIEVAGAAAANGWVPVVYRLRTSVGLDTARLAYLDSDSGLYAAVPTDVRGRFPLMKRRAAGTDTILVLPGEKSPSTWTRGGAAYRQLADSTIVWNGDSVACQVVQRVISAVSDTSLTFYTDTGVVRQDYGKVTQVAGTDTLDISETLLLIDFELN